MPISGHLHHRTLIYLHLQNTYLLKCYIYFLHLLKTLQSNTLIIHGLDLQLFDIIRARKQKCVLYPPVSLNFFYSSL